MIKRPMSRNARPRGFKVKHILQICLLLGVCFWLIYQVKHSHAKKEELDKKDTNIFVKNQNGDVEVNLGRKSLLPRVQEEKNEEDDDEEAAVEEDENKQHGEKHVQDDNKHEGDKPEVNASKSEEDAGEEESKNNEDEKEENNHDEDGNRHEGEEKEEGIEHEEELRDEENNREEEEREEGNRLEEEEEEREGDRHEEENREGNIRDDEEQEEETKSNEMVEEGRGIGDDEIDERKIEGDADREEELVDEEKAREEIAKKETGNEEGETDKEGQANHEEDRDHEAREKHYKADDASSAVTHDSQVVNDEHQNMSTHSSNENMITNNLEQDKNSADNEDISGEQKNSTSELRAVNTVEENGEKTAMSEDQSPENATNEQQLLVDEPVAGGNTNISSTNKPQNETVSGTDDVEALNMITTESELNSTSTVSDNTENAETVEKDFNSSTNSELYGSNNTTGPEVTMEASGSSTAIKETDDVAQDQNSDKSGTGDAVHDPDPIDTLDTSISQDEKEPRIDLDTLPENIAEGVNSRDTAAE